MNDSTRGTPVVTIGVDLGDKYSHLSVVDSEGNVILAERIKTTREDFQKRFRGAERARVVIEAGTHSPWVHRVVEACGHEVIVSNPRQVALISENNQKSDEHDPELLARLGRFDQKLLKPIQPRSFEDQIALAELRARDCIVKARTQLVNHIRGVVKSFGGTTTGVTVGKFHKNAPEQIPEDIEETMVPVLKIIELITQQIAEYDRRVEEISKKKYAKTETLKQVSGVGPLTSLAFLLVIGNPKRFKHSRDVGPYLGLTPGKDDSGDYQPELRITKAGDGFLRRLLVSSSHYILGPFGPDSDLRRFGLRIAAKGNKKAKRRGVIAVARKLAVLLHHLLITEEVYEPLRNANRKQKCP